MRILKRCSMHERWILVLKLRPESLSTGVYCIFSSSDRYLHDCNMYHDGMCAVYVYPFTRLISGVLLTELVCSCLPSVWAFFILYSMKTRHQPNRPGFLWQGIESDRILLGGIRSIIGHLWSPDACSFCVIWNTAVRAQGFKFSGGAHYKFWREEQSVAVQLVLLATR